MSWVSSGVIALYQMIANTHPQHVVGWGLDVSGGEIHHLSKGLLGFG
jgi:hypothetical protein